MNITIKPAKLHGTVSAVPSKSDLHRALICAALADAPTTVLLPSPSPVSEDIAATVRCLEALGAGITAESADAEDYGALTGEFPDMRPVIRFHVAPVRNCPERITLDCGESGSTARFMLPIAAVLCKEALLTGSGRLPERPLSPLTDEMKKHGYLCSADHLPLTLTAAAAVPDNAGTDRRDGTSRGGASQNSTSGADPAFPGVPEYSLPGNISSQFITGLLLAAPLSGGVRIRLTSPLASSSYVDMTIDTMRRFGVTVRKTENGFAVPPSSYRSPETYMTDGGWSSAAFFLAADVLSGRGNAVSVRDLRTESLQGDRVIAEISELFRNRLQDRDTISGTDNDPETAADKPDNDRKMTIDEPNSDREITVDAGDIPDLVPIIAVMAALTPGKTSIVNASRLRLKESDRLHTTAEMLSTLGADITELSDGLTVIGREELQGGTVFGYNDHRIVMSAAIASIGCTKDVTILGAEAVAKSYPSFWDDFAALGGIFEYTA